MFTVAQLEAKLAQLAAQVEQSAANHHVLLGSKLQVEAFLMEAKKAAEVVAAVDPALAPEAEKVEKVSDVVLDAMHDDGFKQ